jgi:hypothetical protein
MEQRIKQVRNDLLLAFKQILQFYFRAIMPTFATADIATAFWANFHSSIVKFDVKKGGFLF